MAGARPPGALPVGSMYNDDEEENSADSVEQAALEGANRDESLLDPDSLMFEEIGDERVQGLDDDDDEEVTMVRKGRGFDDQPAASHDVLFDETDSILNTPYGSPLSDISSIASNQKWIGEVKKMLLDDQRQSENRAKAWATPQSQGISSLSPSVGGMGIESLEQHQWEDQMVDTLPEMGFDMPSAEELAEKYSNDLIEKDLVILEKDKRISSLEKTQRDLESTLEDCQKELRLKTETATSGVEKLKRTLEEKDKCIMETSERLRKVTESYNSSEKRWKEQQDFLEKQIHKLKSELEDKSGLDEEMQKITESSRREKESLEQKLEKAREENDILKQQFDEEKTRLEQELQQLRDEKTALETKLREEIEILKTKLSLSEQAVETALNEKETFRVELESQEEKNRILSSDIVELKGKEDIILQLESQRQELEKIVDQLKQELDEKQELVTTTQRELQTEKENMLKEMEEKQEEFATAQRVFQEEKETLIKEVEETKQRLEVVEVDEAPVNFFRQNNDASTTEPWTDTKKSLEDRIAELELEKGNLLLQLVDVDEHEQQEAQKNAAITAIAEENAKQLESMREALETLERKNEILEKELEESKSRETQRIETAMNTIAWEEKYEELQKENQSLLNELQSQRQAADELSGRYEELEKKCTDLELEKPPIEGVAEIDKCDGWSDGGAPQLPDEGFTEMEAQISELKEALDEKQRQIDEILLTHKEALDEKQRQVDEILLTQKKVLEEKLRQFADTERQNQEIIAEQSLQIEKLLKLHEHVQNMIAEKDAVVAHHTSINDQLRAEVEELKKYEQLQREHLEMKKQEVTSQTSETADGWSDDAPVLLDEGFNEDNQLTELKQELAKKSEELTAKTEKCKNLEDKLKKALRALKQKNDKLAELKNRLGDDAMTVSSVSPMESSMVLEPLVGKSTVSDTGSSPTLQLEVDRWKQECEEKELKIKELATALESLQLIQAANESAINSTAERERLIASLRNELAHMASSLNSKNEEVDQLMKTCEEMQKSVDEKVELLNECVSKKDVEVRQAISQYEDFLKDATLNVSHLTKELEEKIREINQLQGQVQEAQEQLLETQNEYDSYKADTLNIQETLEEKEREVVELKKIQEHLQESLSSLQIQLNDSMGNHSLMNEALDRAEAEKKQLREECVCIQNEYGNKSRELQVQISQLIDQLNERESAISVMEARLKESDEASDRVANEIRYQLEEKSKAFEQTEQSLFVKTEECVRLEERLREAEEQYRRELDAKLLELQEQNRMTLEAYATQTSEDLERTYEQLAKKNTEVSELQENCRQLQDQLARMQGDYSSKCSELSQSEQMVAELHTLKATIQGMEASINSYTVALNTANADINAKNEEIQKLQTICGQYEEKFYNSALAQEGMQRTLQETQSALAQCQQDIGTYYNELQNSKAEVDMLRNSQGENQQTVDRLNAELNEAKTEAARRATEIQNMSNQLAKYQDIEANLNRYLEDLNSATEELGKRNSEYRELEKACKSQEMQIQSLQANVEAVRVELSSAQQAITEKDDRIFRLEAEAHDLLANSQKEEGLSSEKTKELLEELEEKNREISDLRFELEEGIIQEKRLKENLDSREKEIKQLRYELEEKERQAEESWLTLQTVQSSNASVPREEDGPVVDRLEKAEKEKEALERKIDLLQNKLEEVEASEVKCYEDFSRLKVLRTELEMDNLRMSAELEQLRRSLQDGDNDPKYKSMENQLILMTKTLEDRDKLCRDLMKNISQLQESYDQLRIRVNSMTLPQPFAFPPDSLEAKFVEQDRDIFSLRVDLEREKKIRELYEGQLFLAASKKQFENSTRKSTSSGSWFGLGELFSSPSPPRPSPSPSSRSSVSTSLAPPSTQHFDPAYMSSPGRPITPITPATAFPPSLFDTSGQSVQGQQYFVPQISPGPSSGEGTQPAQATSTRVTESPYANFPNQS